MRLLTHSGKAGRKAGWEGAGQLRGCVQGQLRATVREKQESFGKQEMLIPGPKGG